MKLKRHKDIASLFINKKKVEEDCEGMTAGSVLAPSAQATGGNITNTDSSLLIKNGKRLKKRLKAVDAVLMK